MTNSQNHDDPVTGVFIFGREIENNGSILSEGKRPIVHLQTDKYSGKGSVSSTQTNGQSEKWYQKWWVKLVLGGLVSLIVIYIGFKFGWN